MPRLKSANRVAALLLASLALACHHHVPAIRFAPPGTDADQLRTSFALSDAERNSLTPDALKQFTQAQLDQIYVRLSPGVIPDGPFRGDLFFPRGANSHLRVGDVAPSLPPAFSAAAAMPFEELGRALWKGKVFFKSEGILRNRIDDLALLKPLIKDSSSIPKLTFDGETTWLLFPAQVSCGDSLLEPGRRAIVIDYSKGPQITGYRQVPDGLAAPDALDIHDEIRIVKPGLYLGRAYFRGKFGLNFTLVKPDGGGAGPAPDLHGDCV
jgi:hypothetical protein